MNDLPEHLRDPMKVLERGRQLEESGGVTLSKEEQASGLTLQAALLLASVAADDPGDMYRMALKLLGKEYHKQSLLVARQANQLRRLRRSQ